MRSEMEKFQQDLLESVQQMRRGEAARVTEVKSDWEGKVAWPQDATK